GGLFRTACSCRRVACCPLRPPGRCQTRRKPIKSVRSKLRTCNSEEQEAKSSELRALLPSACSCRRVACCPLRPPGRCQTRRKPIKSVRSKLRTCNSEEQEAKSSELRALLPSACSCRRVACCPLRPPGRCQTRRKPIKSVRSKLRTCNSE